MPKTVPNLPGIEPSDYPVLAGRRGQRLRLRGRPGRRRSRASHGAVPGGIEAETRAMLDNVGRLLRAVGLDFADVVKCTVYLRDFGEFAAMNTVYREYFPTEPPTRATVGVTALAADYRIEIEVIARPLVDDREVVDRDLRVAGACRPPGSSSGVRAGRRPALAEEALWAVNERR